MKVKAYWWVTFYFIYLTIISFIVTLTLSDSMVSNLFHPSMGDIVYKGVFGIIFFVSLIFLVSAILTSATMELLEHYSKW